MIKKYIALFLVCCMAQPTHATKPVSMTTYSGNLFGTGLLASASFLFLAKSLYAQGRAKEITDEMTKDQKKLDKSDKEFKEVLDEWFKRTFHTFKKHDGNLKKEDPLPESEEEINKRKKAEAKAHKKKKVILRNTRIKMWIYRALAIAAGVGAAGLGYRHIQNNIQDNQYGKELDALAGLYIERVQQSGDTYKLTPKQRKDIEIIMEEQYGWEPGGEIKQRLDNAAKTEHAYLNFRKRIHGKPSITLLQLIHTLITGSECTTKTRAKSQT